ncbi:serine O-acetyltransferase [Cryobacterium arcticum]|uniref:serine O-acetyltransferase n=1 Tax=Cryobacterium arcticum TaxID=670052 RepID=UPI0009FFF1DC|nr:DapH/DapD/GlmU-related protein [Cryobacterium arcticum]
MIKTKQDYLEFLAADARSLGRRPTLRTRLRDDVFRFQRSLRLVEYLTNTGAPKPQLMLARWIFRRQSIRLGFSIPVNVFGPGLAIAHYGTIVINSHTRIGANCRIHVGVNIGTSAGFADACPVIGDNCYIGPGVKIFGPIEIGPETAIGANAVVTKSFPEGHGTLAGVPARQISAKTTETLLTKGWSNTAAG